MKKEDRVDRRYEETVNTIKTQASRSRRKMSPHPQQSCTWESLYPFGSNIQHSVEARGELEQRPRSLLQLGKGQ